MTNDGNYEFGIAGSLNLSSKVIVEIQSKNNAYIALAEEKKHESIKYEILLGVDNNGVCKILSTSPGSSKELAVAYGNFLNENKVCKFEISWDDGENLIVS
jgi:hypothetical protein